MKVLAGFFVFCFTLNAHYTKVFLLKFQMCWDRTLIMNALAGLHAIIRHASRERRAPRVGETNHVRVVFLHSRLGQSLVYEPIRHAFFFKPFWEAHTHNRVQVL
jgi:hypothetical protein